MKIEKMTKAAVRDLSDELKQELEEFAKERGLDVAIKGGKYDPTVGTFVPKVEFSIAGAEEREFALIAPSFGLDADDYGAEFEYGGKRFRLTGLNTRRPKYPVSATNLRDGKPYKLPEAAVEKIRRVGDRRISEALVG